MTAIRRQYLRVKQSYPEAIVFFRLGDFYETFDEDARLASKELGITLTSREMGKGNRIPMAGIPYHALDSYLAKLVGRGYKVALCEQLTPPAGKGLVPREVMRVVTPGTVVDPKMLPEKSNNYLLSLIKEGDFCGMAYADATTGEFTTSQMAWQSLPGELERIKPSEILVPKGQENIVQRQSAISPLAEDYFSLEQARESLLSHLQSATLEAFGCQDLPLAVRAAGALFLYLKETQKGALEQINRLSTCLPSSFMMLDAPTRRNLELFQSSRQGTIQGSLLSILDLTRTPMGGRMLRQWLGQPLLELTALDKRQDAVETLFSHSFVRSELWDLLKDVADIERLINRVRNSMAYPRELIALKQSLEKVPAIISALGKAGEQGARMAGRLEPQPDMVNLISISITDNPAHDPEEGPIIREGFSPELDTLRHSSKQAKTYLANLEQREKERTGIKSLRVNYNRVFGYYIEVSKVNLSHIPADYIRKQTLTDVERFYTPELKEYESTILNAQERMVEMERSLFRQVCQQAGLSAERVLTTARALAEIDAYLSLAEAAFRYNYVRPSLNNEDCVIIDEGRHPVVERCLGEGVFVPNDTYLSNKDCQIIILTGPNMAGKSTYLRQVALIVLMAQAGSFVPAKSATIGVVDRIFTRVGLQDDLTAGQSTFMVEMVETAYILNNATSRSLLVLDEIGRGTSTYDGISIARAVAEFIHNHHGLGAKTLFATHYHELTDLAQTLPRVKNFNVAVSEEGEQVVFLRKIVPGGADRSYGIHVAKLAGMPRPILRRAQEILSTLEDERVNHKGKFPTGLKGKQQDPGAAQIALFAQSSVFLEEMAKMDIDSLSPLEAITRLYELKKRAQEESAK